MNEIDIDHMNQTTANTQNQERLVNHKIDLFFLRAFEVEGVRIQCTFDFVGNLDVIARLLFLSEVEKMELMLKVLEHTKETLQKELDIFFYGNDPIQ